MRYLSIIISALVVFSCTKDKVPVNEPIPIAERISGTYNVYDTNEVFLYEMEMKYVINNSVGFDSLIFKNIDNDFNYSSDQSSIDNDYDNSKFISFVSPFPTKDKNNKSWRIFNITEGSFDNIWRNDTIRMCFNKHNTPWWPSESVPYLDTIIKQIAVKQY
ncbi:MAG: hypothetical protein ACK476_08620 [Fluviicola sp.]|jgi:hypothetical protein